MSRFLVLIGILNGGIHSLSGQVIQTTEKREALLEGLRSVVKNTERDALALDQLESPFVEPFADPLPEVTERAEGDDPDAVEAVPRTQVVLSDAVALQMVSRQFNPLGSLILGERALLQLENGSTMPVGQVFSAEINGIRYEVKLENVSNNGYELRIGDATLLRRFTENRLRPNQ